MTTYKVKWTDEFIIVTDGKIFSSDKKCSLSTAILIFLVTITAFLRFFITPRLNLPTVEGSYEAFAHLLVGGLLIGAFRRPFKRSWFLLGVILTLIEAVIFFLQKQGFLQ